MSPLDILYLESTYGPVEGFVHVCLFDGRHSPYVLVSAQSSALAGVLPTEMPESYESRYRFAQVQVSDEGEIDRESVLSVVARVLPMFRACQAYYQWNNNPRESQGVLEVELVVEDGKVARGTVGTEGFAELPRVPGAFRSRGFDRTECLSPFRALRWVGSGTVRIRIDVQVDPEG